ncbi:MAG TPA: hypothetical protein VFU63_11065 [Ktedonobacterales bacterium]|nr:hypothetical protein [Ktedonobacterales bacterium]
MDWSPTLDTLADILAKMGGEGWLVGGCLRDALLGLRAADVDVVVTGNPLPAAERLAWRLSLALARLGHGTIRLIPRDAPAMRLDLSPLAGEDIAGDLARRDFTVNAMALPLSSHAQWSAAGGNQRADMPGLLDPFGGRDDLLAHRLVAVGPDVFRHDPGRIIRAARLRTRFGLLPDATTREQARASVPSLATLSADRLREEMALLLALPAATDGVALLDALGALVVLYPGLTGDAAPHALATLRCLDTLMGVAQAATSYPALRAWGASDSRRVGLRLAALRHARDTHNTQSGVDDHMTLWQIARATLASENTQERLYATRLLFAHAGKEEAAAADALVVAAACALASDGQAESAARAARADALIDIYLRDRSALIPPLLLGGSDLIAALGLTPGPAIGRLLLMVRRAQLLGEIASRDEALALARRLHESGSGE